MEVRLSAKLGRECTVHQGSPLVNLRLQASISNRSVKAESYAKKICMVVSYDFEFILSGDGRCIDYRFNGL